MTLSIEAFGMGLGLVLIGWVAGLVVSYAFSMARNIRFLG